jgi:hypothetical protein
MNESNNNDNGRSRMYQSRAHKYDFAVKLLDIFGQKGIGGN